jgi:hypothetical protein
MSKVLQYSWVAAINWRWLMMRLAVVFKEQSLSERFSKQISLTLARPTSLTIAVCICPQLHVDSLLWCCRSTTQACLSSQLCPCSPSCSEWSPCPWCRSTHPIGSCPLQGSGFALGAQLLWSLSLSLSTRTCTSNCQCRSSVITQSIYNDDYTICLHWCEFWYQPHTFASTLHRLP